MLVHGYAGIRIAPHFFFFFFVLEWVFFLSGNPIQLKLGVCLFVFFLPKYNFKLKSFAYPAFFFFFPMVLSWSQPSY